MARFFSALRNFNADQRAQDAFEYVLIIGAVTVAVILAIATPVGTNLIRAVVTGACNAIVTLPNMGGVSCANLFAA